MRRAAVLAIVALSVAALAACGHTVTGTAVPDTGPSGGDRFTNLLRECKTVPEDQIARTVGGTTTTDEFFGAVCRWSIDGGTSWVTFNWFEHGTTTREADVGRRLGYQVGPVSVGGIRSLQFTRAADPGSCGVTTVAPQQGVLGWWVQYPGPSRPVEPCQAARRLAELSLNRTQ